MANNYNSFSKATVCKGNTCVTVYGNAAKVIEMIVVTSVILLALTLVSKALN